MTTISPDPEQIRDLVARIDDGPVVMINLLKFRERAKGGECSGVEAYRRYARVVRGMIADQGGRTVWSGRADQILIGDSEQDWDMAWLVEYPTRRAFLEMVSQPEWQEAHASRDAGLERTSLIACTPFADGEFWGDAVD